MDPRRDDNEQRLKNDGIGDKSPAFRGEKAIRTGVSSISLVVDEVLSSAGALVLSVSSLYMPAWLCFTWDEGFRRVGEVDQLCRNGIAKGLPVARCFVALTQCTASRRSFSRAICEELYTAF